MHRVTALALPDVVAFDLAIPAQIFGHRDETERYRFEVCTPAPEAVPTTTGFDVVATAALEDLGAADTVIVPGFAPLAEPPAVVLDALVAAHRGGARIVSLCTGAFALAPAGLLDGRSATTHWRDAGELARRYPQIRVRPDVLYVDDGDVCTSAGVAAGIDLCLQLVRADHGAEHAARIARRMVVAPHRHGGQAQFVDRPLPADPGGGLAATRAWALEHLHEPLTVAALAAHAGWSPRSLARHFRAETGTTPLRWLHAARVDTARRLLESTDSTVEEVAGHVGLGTAANLRTHFARVTGTTPSAYRAAFRTA